MPHSSTRILLLGIWSHLSRRRRIQLWMLLSVMLVSGGAELVSLGAVMPFLAVLSDPNLIWHQPIVQRLATLVGFTEANQLLLPATLAFVVATLITAIIRLSNLWLNGRLAAAIGSDLSCEAYRRTLHQPYSFHIQSNTSEVILVTTTQINYTVGAFNALLQLVTSAVVAAGLITGLIFIDAQVALGAAALFSSAYALLAVANNRELHRNGQKIAAASSQQLKSLQEGLGAIRDVLLDGNQQTYLQIYREADRPQRQHQARNVFLGAFPRFALESLGMIAIALLGGLLAFQRGSGAAVVPLLGGLALGAQRLLPALQQIYTGWAALKGFNAPMKAVLDMLDLPLPKMVNVSHPLDLRDGICLKRVHFRYSPGEPEVLRGLDLNIARGERIGLIGTTGSGKSTTVDLLMGLLEPSTGTVLVDGEDIHDHHHPERLAAWRAAIAHVPQSIYLADSSVAENIAFGVPRDMIDLKRVKQAALQAQIDDFIESCKEGYDSFVGERGIRLSGGQRQRIGVARALYKNANVLVFDEATSALDTGTEQDIMRSIDKLSSDITVILIAHRLSTLRHCDRIVRLDQGILVAEGSPSQILDANC